MLRQDRQRTYDVTLRHVRAITTAVEKKCVTYAECVAVALGIHQAMPVHHIVISGLSGSTIFFHIISQTARFSKTKFIEHKMCFDFLYKFCLKSFSFWEELSEILS
jgi:hypothetical protein